MVEDVKNPEVCVVATVNPPDSTEAVFGAYVNGEPIPGENTVDYGGS